LRSHTRASKVHEEEKKALEREETDKRRAMDKVEAQVRVLIRHLRIINVSINVRRFN
jgi:hypothetical protein